MTVPLLGFVQCVKTFAFLLSQAKVSSVVRRVVGIPRPHDAGREILDDLERTRLKQQAV